MGLGVPYSKSIVLKNAIDPIEYKEKSKDQIRLIYHTTPHRGLELLVPVMEKLSEMFPPNAIHLDIYSSFEAYGWKERDKPYAQLFETAKNHPNMTYHGFKPNAVIRKALQDAHIFAYPSIWVETSCIAAIEAMSAGCQVVCSNLGALPETTGNFATMYHYNEDPNHHANVFAHFLFNAIMNYWDSANQDKLAVQKNWADYSYNWESRAAEWSGLLQGLAKQYS
jgi:glycosyltransferase involved in cell wall biosynthesis